MIFSLENKFVESPKIFLHDNIEENIKDLFHCDFFSNGTFGIRYRTKISGVVFNFNNQKTYKVNPTKSSARTDMRISARGALNPNVDLTASYHLEKPNRFSLNFSIKKILNTFSLSTSLVSEKGIVKDMTLTPTIEDADKRIKIQFMKSFSTKRHDKPFLILLKTRNSFQNFHLYEKGLEIVTEERISDFKEYSGTNMIRFNLDSPNYFGLLASHKFSLKALRPRIEHMTGFYKSPNTIFNFGFTENHKQVKSYHAAIVKYMNSNLEMGIKFDSDDHHHNYLQLGLSYFEGRSHFKYKINNGLRNFLYYSYKINDKVKIATCFNFALRTSEADIHPDDNVILPFGLKLEING